MLVLVSEDLILKKKVGRVRVKRPGCPVVVSLSHTRGSFRREAVQGASLWLVDLHSVCCTYCMQLTVA